MGVRLLRRQVAANGDIMERQGAESGLAKMGTNRRWLGLVVAVTLLFVAIAEPTMEAAIFAMAAAVFAATVRHHLRDAPATSFRLAGLLRFVPYFASISVRGGLDVARRSLAPSLPIEPGFMEYGLTIDPESAAAVFFGAVISLVPGTLCVELDGEPTVLVHVVDLDADINEELRELEERVADLFGSPMDRQETSNALNDGREPP